MNKRSKLDRMVLVTREQVLRQPTDRGRLARLRAAPDRSIDLSDLPEDADSIRRGARHGSMRMAVYDAMRMNQLTAYGLWKLARRYCPTLPQSAVYEFLAGRRAIGLNYIEALMKALDLVVVPRKKRAG